jgi:hypothetical protein
MIQTHVLRSGLAQHTHFDMLNTEHMNRRLSQHETARLRVCHAVNAVMTNTDIVSIILNGNVGPNTLGIASQVCKIWHEVCSTETVLRAAALYIGGLTRGVFCGMFAVSYAESRALPHAQRKSRNMRIYFLYTQKAVDAVLNAGGSQALRERRRRRITSQFTEYTPANFHIERWRMEEILHAKVSSKRSV